MTKREKYSKRYLKRWRRTHRNYSRDWMRRARTGIGRTFVTLLGVRVRADYLRMVRRGEN